MDNRYSAYLKAIQSQRKGLIATLTRWCNQNSHSDNPEGLDRMLGMLEESFALLGGSVKRIPIPPRRLVDSKGNATKCAQGAALQIIKRPRAPIRLLLAGHMDTVFPISSPFQKVTAKGARLKGPGVADMKGGLLIMLKALEALECSPWAKQIGWEVLITPDEETGSCGSARLYESAAKKYHAGLIFEPSFPDGYMVSSRKGSSNLVITAKGKSAHAGRDFHAGRNAVTALARLLVNLEQMTDPEKGVTVNIGHIEGGGAFNIVPDHASARVNIRVGLADDAEVVEDCLQMLVEEANTQEGIALKVHTLASRAPKPIDEPTCRLFSLFQECGKTLGTKLRWKPTGGVCDGNILAGCGLPTLDTLGAIGGELHTADEYIETDSLADRSCLTALFLLKLAAGEITLPSREAFP